MLVVRPPHITLPAGVAGIGFRQPVGNGEIGAIGRECAGKIALMLLRGANLVVRNRQIALPAGIAGIGLRQQVSDVQSVPV